MATEYVADVGGDGSFVHASLSAAVSSLACDLTAATTQVWTYGSYNGSIVGMVVTGALSSVTATCVGQSDNGQLLLANIDGPFTAGERLDGESGNYAYLGGDSGDSAYVTIYCHNILDTSQVTITGWTTSATNYLNIRSIGANRHVGARDTDMYRLIVNAPSSFALGIQIGAEYTRLDGLQIRNSSSTVPIGVEINVGDTSDIRISDCIVYDITGTTSPAFAITSGVTTFMNCAAMNVGIGFYNVYTTGTVYATNCTAINCGYAGFSADSGTTLNVKNCYAGASGNFDYDTIIGSTWVMSACYSSDGSRSTSIIACSTSTGARFRNVTAGSEDVRLTSASSLRNVGISQPSWTHPSGLVGVAGNKRFFKWDVGFDEYRIPNPTGGRPDEPDAPQQQEN